MRNAHKSSVGKLAGKSLLGGPRQVILKRILREYIARMMGFIWLKYDLVEDTCDHCNELSVFMKGRMFVMWVTTTFPARAMLHVVLPLSGHLEYGRADRLT
jgi:hypothetical protein